MAANGETTTNDKSNITFGEREIAVLREIASDWINERIVMPPFEPEVLSVLEKLGLADKRKLLEPELPHPIQLD